MISKITTALVIAGVLSGCGSSSDSSSGASAQRLSIDNLTPISGSDSIIGTWVGAADFTEIDQWSDGFTQNYNGSRLAIFQIRADGIGGYELTNCNHTDVDVSYNPQTNVLSTLNRSFTVSNFNTMAGSTTQSEWGEEGQENWKWVKVSNSTNGIGNLNITGENSAALLSICRDSYSYSDSDGDKWVSTVDSGAYLLDSFPERFDIQSDSDGWGNIDFSQPDIEFETFNPSEKVSISVQSSDSTNYRAAYSASSNSNSLSATVIVQIAD